MVAASRKCDARMLKELARTLLPRRVMDYLRDMQRKRLQAHVAQLPVVQEEDMRVVLKDTLQLRSGDIVFVHSSIDKLNLGFPFYRLLALLREAIGDEGTMLFPTYPKLTSYKFLKSGEVFDVRRTPSYTGILTEFARRQRGGLRSLHPTKSVVALGPHAEMLTRDHPSSPYPYDAGSPYFKVIENGGVAIGLGVATTNLSLVHCVDDALKEQFPVQPYHNELFQAPCLDYSGKEQIISTYAHDMRKMDFDIPAYMAANIPTTICKDTTLNGMKFFRADTAPLFEKMMELARDGVTIYWKKHYK